MNDNQGTKNDFIREQIKEKPLNKKKYMVRVGMSALCGGVFALSASVVFAVVMPYLSVEGKSKETVLDTEQLMVSEKETEEVTENKDTVLYVYCRSGARSRQAVSLLKHMGYTNVHNIGGIAAYTGKVE